MSSTWANAALAGTSLAAGLVLLGSAARRPTARPAGLAHALMGIGMAGMFSPWGDPVPPIAGATVFLAIALWFAAQGLRSDRLGTTESVHLVIGPAAMVLMYLAMGSRHGAGGTHTGGSPLLSVAALALIGYFVWYAWFLVGHLPGPAAVTGTGGVAVAGPVPTARLLTGSHIGMCVLMALLFLGGV